MVLAEQAFLSRIIKGERFRTSNERTNFYKENAHTEYFLRYASKMHYQNMHKIHKTGDFFILRDITVLHANSIRSSSKERRAARRILSLFIRKRTERKIKLRSFSKHKSKITKIQSWIRGVQTRKLYKELFGKLPSRRRQKGRKVTTEQMAAKIQAVTRGYLFRKRIKKGLENATKKRNNLDDCPEIDIDDFLGTNSKGLDNTEDDFLMVPDQEQLRAILENIKASKNTVPELASSILPDINKTPVLAHKKGNSRPFKVEDERLPALNQKNLSKLPDVNKIPTGSEISEYELRSESHPNTVYKGEIGGRKAMEEVKQKVNNFSGGAKPSENIEIREKSKKFSEEWGIKGEDSKKVVEAWIGKMVKRKQKKQVLTPEERFQRFLANKPSASGINTKSKLSQNKP